MKSVKARLRAWLIDLVREAIRIERRQTVFQQEITDQKVLATMWKERKEMVKGKIEFPGITRPAWEATDAKPISDQSFEQLQEEALKAQEEYYEPERA